MVKVRNAKDRLITNKKQYMKTPNKMKTPAKFNAKLEAAVDSGDIKPGKFADAVKAGAPMKTPMKMNKKPGSAMDMKSGFKMKSGPMNMKVKGSVAKMAGVSPMKDTTELEAKGKKLIIDTPVSGSQQVKNLKKYQKLGKNDPNYAKTLNLSKQRSQSESEDSKKS